MSTNNSVTSARFAKFKLSLSYPNTGHLYSKKLNYNKSFSFNSFNKSWNSYKNSNSLLTKSIMSEKNYKNMDTMYNCDLQPLNWLQKESIIDIDPLVDIEDEMLKDESYLMNTTPGYEDLINPQINHAKVEVESQENSNIQDFVRFQSMRNSMNNTNRLSFRNNSSLTPSNTGSEQCPLTNQNNNYSPQASGYFKPNLSYTQLIFMAIETCKDRAMTVNDIYQWCEINYPYYKHIGPSWKNSLRHNLSINKSFRRMPRDGQQGGPGRGAYWVVDEKDRKNLLDSIYRTNQIIPISDGNAKRIETNYSLIVNPPKNGPMLCIDGQFTDASTYLQSKHSDEDFAKDNSNVQLDSTISDKASPHPLTNEKSDVEYSTKNLKPVANNNPEGLGDDSIKLSASYSSINSPPEEQDDTSLSKPKIKNRRKSKHEKVRSYRELESAVKDCSDTRRRRQYNCRNTPSHKYNNQTMTSVNVIVAPHFDHIYARYQQFLPPAISSNMDKAVFAPHDEQNLNTDAEFLKLGNQEENEDEDDNEDRDEVADDYNVKINSRKCVSKEENDTEMNEEITVKLEKLDSEETIQQSLIVKEDNNRSTRIQNRHLKGTNEFKVHWSVGTTKFKTNNVAFNRQSRVKRAINKRLRRSLRNRHVISHKLLNVEVKQELVEPCDHPLKEELSDGYGTDSTMPMIARKPNVRKNHQLISKRLTAAKGYRSRLKPVKRKSSITKTFPEKRYRSKRKRTRPLRIDEFQEVTAIQFLANLRNHHQKLTNIENLYNLNTFLKSTITIENSPQINSSIILVHD